MSRSFQRVARLPVGDTLFAAERPADLSKYRYSETSFEYLNRSTKPCSELARALIEGWLSMLPVQQQKTFLARMRKRQDGFDSGFQELMLNALLVALQCSVAMGLPQSGGTPDFNVVEGRGNEFCLEACHSTTVTTGPDISPRARRIREMLSQLDLPYLIAIDELNSGSSALSEKRLLQHIQDGIRVGTPGRLDGSLEVPDLITADGWRVQLTLYDRSKYGSRPTSIMQEAYRNSHTAPYYSHLLGRLEKKSKRYTALNKPYVIALNSAELTDWDLALEHALFGAAHPVGVQTSPGFWGTEDNPRNSSVSAVLFTSSLCHATLLMGRVFLRFAINPWARFPYKGVLERLPTLHSLNGDILRSPGLQLHQILGIEPHDSKLWN